nr:Ig-like domain repeat protein [Methanobrevibacter smithii]
MKLNKMMLVSMLLLAILTLGAVSAQEDSSADVLAVDSASSHVLGDGISYDKTIYVNTTGDDSNTGSQNSPYATINKGISSVNASDNAVIYLSKGTFTGDNNTDLSISLAHEKYGGSLTIIGQGNDKTFIDGESVSSFLKSVSGDTALTLINISFINGKASTGSMINCGGNLTVDNCVFENNYATGSQGAIVSKGMDLKVTNSVFKNNKASNQGPDICFNNNKGNVYIDNSSFYNATNTGYSCGASVFIYNSKNAKITGNTFKDVVGNYNDAALKISSGNGQIMNNVFINCTNSNTDTGNWAQYGVIYLEGNNILKQNKFINSSSNKGLIYNNGLMNAVITFNDVFTDKTTFTLSATIIDDMGNTISSSRTIEFDIDGIKVGESGSNKGVATLSVSQLFDNGKHEITGKYNGENNTFNPATLTVDVDRTPVEFWVSTSGNDTTGDGSKNNPFNTIDHAITAALDKSINITIHIMDGTYLGTGNVNLKYSRIAVLNLIGENYGKTIIDGQDNDYFFYFDKGLDVAITNLTFTNGKAGNINWNRGIIYGSSLTMNDCIIKNSVSNTYLVYDINTQNSRLFFDNLTYVNNTGNMWLGYASINNSLFENNTGKGIGGVIRGTNFITVTNSKFINNTNPSANNAEGGAIYSSSIVSINNTYESNTGSKGGAVYVSFTDGSAAFINDTFINNVANVDGGAIYLNAYNSKSAPNCTIENVKFINNTAKNNGGAISLSGATIKNTIFENNSANLGGAIYLMVIRSGNIAPDLNISSNSIFKNNKAITNGKDIFLYAPSTTSEKVANVTDLTITFNDLAISTLADTLTASVTHPTGAVIGGNSIKFYINGSYAGVNDVIDGVASYKYIGFKDGVYTLSGIYSIGANDSVYKNGTLTVNISEVFDNITVYVSDKNGNDSTADGTINHPFKTIKNALDFAFKKSYVITIRVLEGNYTGDLNTNITIQASVQVSIVGDGMNKTIINGENLNYFAKILAGDKTITITNMTLFNMTTNYVQNRVISLQSPVSIEKGCNVIIDGVNFTAGHGYDGGAIRNNGNLKVNNSYFFNCGDTNNGGAIYNTGYLTIDNSKFIANHAKFYGTIYNTGTVIMNNSEVQDGLRVNGWSGNYATVGGQGNLTIDNSKFWLSGRNALDIVNKGDTWADNPNFEIGIGGDNVFVSNSVFDGFNSTKYKYKLSVFGAGTGVGTDAPKNLKLFNTTVKNVATVFTRVNNLYADGCIFENFTSFISYGSNNFTVNNSVLLGDVKGNSRLTPAIFNFDNNWWGDNSQPTYNLGGKKASPNTWLVLTLDATNKTGLIQDITLAFKVFNGTNITDYTGSLAAREFTMNVTFGVLASENGTIINNFVNNFVAAEDGTYTAFAKVDDQILNVSGKVGLGSGIIKVNDAVFNYGDLIVINATLVDTNALPITNVNMTITVNGKNYTVVTDENGVASVVIDKLSAGKYDVNYKVDKNDIIQAVSNSSSLIINQGKADLNVNITSGIAGEDVVIVVNGPKDLKENITVTVDKTNYNVVLVNGSASLTLKDLTAGNYDVTVSYPGDNNYYNQVIKTNFTVDINKKVNLNISDIVMIYKDGTRMIAVLTDYLGNPIANATLYFTINGKTYVKTTDDKGTASMGLNLVSKVYDATISYNGSDKYDAVSKNITVTINPTIISEDLVKMYQNATRFYAKFTDSTGKALANSEVRFNIHGVFYTKTTNKDGVADLGIMLRPGTYILTAYNPVTGEEKGFNITVKSLIVQNDLTKYYLNASRFQATIYNKDGSLAVNKEVTFNINGVFYTKTTDENGVASLGIALRPGSYIITTIFDGLAMGNNVVVIPTLVTKDLNMKYLDGSDFTAQTLDGQGKPLSNQNVSFNVNGVFYHKVTDENGIASLKIRLMSGEYIITSYWNDFQTGNTIKISP